MFFLNLSPSVNDYNRDDLPTNVQIYFYSLKIDGSLHSDVLIHKFLILPIIVSILSKYVSIHLFLALLDFDQLNSDKSSLSDLFNLFSCAIYLVSISSQYLTL